MIARIRSLTRMLLSRDDFERSMSDEMRFHVQEYTDDLVQSGMSPEQARRRARVEFGPQAALKEDCREARGIRVADELRQDLREEPPRTIYTALAQSRLGSRETVGDVRRITVAVQTTTNPATLAPIVRAEVGALSQQVIVSYVRTMEQQFNAALLRERLMTFLSVGYGVLALVLSLVGLYGITSFGVAQRTHDIGIQMALGATRGRVLATILHETVTTSTLGIAVGGVAAIWAANLISPFLFGIPPRDPWTLGGVVAVLTATTLVAGYFPGRRAASIDPVRALKGD